MSPSRRSFLGSIGLATATATAAATIGRWPSPRVAAAARAQSLPPRRHPIRLSSNENPYGPSPRVLEAMRESMAEANRYPNAAMEEMAARLARLHRIGRDQVMLGCGSTEILKMAADAFTGPGKRLVIASPTFEAIGFYARNRGAEVVQVPLTGDFAHDIPAMLKVESAGLLYLCNPNNPTASLTPRRHIDELLAALPTTTWVVVDEAYHHFAVGAPDYQSLLDVPSSNPRLIVARTFSKIYGLAGMRLGYAVAPAATIERLRAHSFFDNVNVAVLRCGLAALEDHEATTTAVRRNAIERDQFLRQARHRGLTPIPSCANFVMVKIGQPVRPLIAQMQARGIEVGRPFPPLDSYLRVSLGLPDEMTAFWKTWDELRSNGFKAGAR